MITIRQIFNWSLALFVVIGTLFYISITSGMKVNPIEWGYQVQELFFRYGVIYLFALTLFMVPLRNVKFSWFGAVLVYLIVVSIVISFGNPARRAILNIALAALFYKIVVEHYDFRNHRFFMKSLTSILIANLVLCTFQFFQHDPLYSHIQPDVIPYSIPIGFMRAEPHLGTLAAVIAPAIAFLHPLFALLALPLIWFSKSSAACISYLLVAAVLAWSRLRTRRGRGIFLSILGVMLLAGVGYVMFYDMPGGQFGERFKVWFAAISIPLKNSPFFGMGIGAWSSMGIASMQGNNTPINWVWTHNEFLQFWFETGIFGSILLFKYISSMVRKFMVYRDSWTYQTLFSAFSVVMMISVLHFPFHIARLAIPCLFIMALNEAYYYHKSTEAKEHEKVIFNSTSDLTCSV